MRTRKNTRIYVDGHDILERVRRSKYWDTMVVVLVALAAVDWITGGEESNDYEPLLFWPCFAAVIVLAWRYADRWAKHWLMTRCKVVEEEVVLDKEE